MEITAMTMTDPAVRTQDVAANELAAPAFLALPEGSGPFPGVVVIHEFYGLNENIKDITRRFAQNGYAALAVDLFGRGNRVLCIALIIAGQLTATVKRSGFIANGISDLKVALRYLSRLPEVDPARLGAIGFCLGGSYAIAWACTDQRLKAIAPFYGTNPRPLDAVARICPVVGSYPGRDFTARSGRKLEVALQRYGVPHDIKVYPGARHAFFNDQLPGSYDAAAATDSWERVLRFFAEHVAGRTT
jgi:carboxymethylenebutenolidase